MKLIAYVIDGHEVAIRPAPLERDWMEATSQRFAYRCLPLAIANVHGWELLCRDAFTALWDGGAASGAITVEVEGDAVPDAVSHFGHGVLTFHVPCLFRTEPGFDLIVQGPINRPKDGIAPLAGVVETDWAPYTFTMNWLFTRPGQRVRFEKGEPFCHIFPVRRSDIEAVEPELRLLSEAPELKRQHEMWSASRTSFNAELKRAGSDAQAEKWQKLYARGLDAAGQPAAGTHRTRLKLRPFRRP